MMDLAPTIGLTARREIIQTRPADALEVDYSAAVIAAGGVPFIVPLTSSDEQNHLNGVDALVLTGGGDIDPARYGSIPSPFVGGIDPHRDAVEILLVRTALSRRIPVLGICRGCQLLNVALGGTLIQHLPDVTALSHLVPAFREDDVHTVWVEAGSHLAAAVGGGELAVNSVHHQAVGALAPGLRAVAWAPDGIVEAIESMDGLCVGIQWHPENLQQAPRHRALFNWLVIQARERRASVSSPTFEWPKSPKTLRTSAFGIQA